MPLEVVIHVCCGVTTLRAGSHAGNCTVQRQNLFVSLKDMFAQNRPLSREREISSATDRDILSLVTDVNAEACTYVVMHEPSLSDEPPLSPKRGLPDIAKRRWTGA